MKHTLIDKFGNLLGTLETSEKSSASGFSGELNNIDESVEVIKLLRKYEGYVNDQVLTLLDKLEEEIDSYGLRIKETDSSISNVQLFGKKISYELK